MIQEKAYIDEILARYFPPSSWVTWTGKSGVNNTTQFVAVHDEKYVLRIYETHQDEEKVKYEHAILLALNEMQLPFSIPEPILTHEGSTYVRSKDGKIAGLFRFLDGVNPDLNEIPVIHSFGKTAGQLSEVLATIQINQLPAYRPYYEIESTHPSCPLSEILCFCISPPIEFSEETSNLLNISEQLDSFLKQVPTLKQLPHQLVHGDLNGSNILVDQDGFVSAVLDFEFITNDLRVMELAVCLSDFISNSEETIMWAKIDAFLSGYGQSLKLSEDEINALPVLIQLRSLDVFIHFLGRYWDQVNSIETVKVYISKAVLRCNWIAANKDKLITLCARYLTETE